MQVISVHRTHIASVSSRLAGQQAAEDQQYIRQQKISSISVAYEQLNCTSVSRVPAIHQLAENCSTVHQSVSRGSAVLVHTVNQQRTGSTSTSVSRGPAVHQSAEEQEYNSQHRNKSKAGSRGPALHQLAEDQQNCASVSRGPAVHKSAEYQQYISQQRTSSTSISRGPAVH